MVNSNNKIIIGAAQFGMDYGVNNSRGKISEKEVYNILNYAFLNGINEIDTASNYGDSEIIIGNYLKKFSNNPFKVSTKISSKDKLLKEQVQNSLERLKLSKVHKILFHSYSVYDYFKNQLDEFRDYFREDIYNEIGVSVYTNEEIELLINDNRIQIIQAPFNLLDNFNYRGESFKKVKLKGKKLDVRSVFLQGLFFKNQNNLNKNMLPFKDSIIQLNEISKSSGYKIEELALGYVNTFNFIDKIVIGVDSLSQLKSNLKSFSIKLSKEIKNSLESIVFLDSPLLNPKEW